MSARLCLPSEAVSVSQARRWVAARLDGPTGEVAQLLVSELVTNAVLHSGTQVELAMDRTLDGVRVEVEDFSPTLPSAKHYAPDAGTGRGLVLVDALASTWGIVGSPTGKVVWFTLAGAEAPGRGAVKAPVPPSQVTPAAEPAGTSSTPAPSEAMSGSAALSSDFDAGVVTIQLRRVPVPILRQASEQYDGLFREFRLIVERDPAQSRAVPGRLLELADQLASRFSSFTIESDAEVRAALAGHDQTIDLEYRLPAAAGAASASYDRLLDEADEYCRAGRQLLTVAASDDAVALRKWFLGEFARQLAGDPPVPWPKSPWAQSLLVDAYDPGRDHARTTRT